MRAPTDITVLIYSANGGIARTVRMALRGIGIRIVHLAANKQQTIEAFGLSELDALVVNVDKPEADAGLDMIQFIRRSDESPNKRIPIVAISDRRDLVTVNAVINAGGHEYVLFPTSGETLLKKITAARQPGRLFIEQRDYVGPCRRRRDNPAYAGPERRRSVRKEAAAS